MVSGALLGWIFLKAVEWVLRNLQMAYFTDNTGKTARTTYWKKECCVYSDTDQTLARNSE